MQSGRLISNFVLFIRGLPEQTAAAGEVLACFSAKKWGQPETVLNEFVIR